MAWLADKELSTYQKRIRNDLLRQLEQQGKDTSYYRDMVNDYIVMMRTRDQLQEKIKDLKKVTNDYVDDSLRRTEEAVAEALSEIRNSRSKFRALVNPQAKNNSAIIEDV